MQFVIDWLPLAILGAGLGLLGGMFGIGGGIIAIPILVLGFSMDQATAQGTAAAMMVPNLAVAWFRYARSNPLGISWQAGAAAVLATTTTWVTASFAQYANQNVLQLVFGVFLICLSVSRLIQSNSPGERTYISEKYIPLVGLVSGGCMGFLGVGGGLLAPPILTGFFGLKQRVAQSIALALVTPSAIAGLATYASHGRVDWPIGIVLAAGGVVMVSYGVALAHSWSEKNLQRAFGMILLVMSILIIMQASGVQRRWLEQSEPVGLMSQKARERKFPLQISVLVAFPCDRAGCLKETAQHLLRSSLH